jgi:heat shock protein HslJ
MRHELSTILALTGALLLLTACSPAPQPPAPAVTPQPAAEPQGAAELAALGRHPSVDEPPAMTGSTLLEGITWHRIGADGEPQAATIRFEGGRLQGFGGCNRFVGSYSVEGGRVRIDAAAATMRACEDYEVMVAESALLAALAGTHEAVVEDGRLTLVAAGTGEPLLVFAAAPAPRLDGVAWKVTGFNNGRQAVVGPLEGTTLELSFDEKAIYGHAGCNRFRALYTLDGNNIHVDPPAATRMFCGEEGVMEQEQQFLEALASAATWSVERGILDMHRADGERALMAREADQ